MLSQNSWEELLQQRAEETARELASKAQVERQDRIDFTRRVLGASGCDVETLGFAANWLRNGWRIGAYLYEVHPDSWNKSNCNLIITKLDHGAVTDVTWSIRLHYSMNEEMAEEHMLWNQQKIAAVLFTPPPEPEIEKKPTPDLDLPTIIISHPLGDWQMSAHSDPLKRTATLVATEYLNSFLDAGWIIDDYKVMPVSNEGDVSFFAKLSRPRHAALRTGSEIPEPKAPPDPPGWISASVP